MKKIYVILATLLLAPSTFAYDFTALDINGNTIYYNKLGGDSVEVTNNGSQNTYSGNIVVPNNVKNNELIYRVTTIGASAFQACTLSSLSLPIGIQEIKSNAFNTAKLNTDLLYLPNLKKIGSSAFSICWNLRKLQMPKLQQIIGGGTMFRDCYELEEIVFPDELKKSDQLSMHFFDSDVKLKGIKLPSNLKTIPISCFSACWSLKYVILPDSTESIGENAFLGCIWLKSITIPANVKTIGDTFICGKAWTYWGGAPYDDTRFTGGKVDGLLPNDANNNQLNSIYFEGLTPPQVTTKTFANITKDKVTCYVPEEALTTYKADSLYVKAFAAIKGYHLGDSKVENITSYTAQIKWLPDSAVTQYTIDLYISGTKIAQYIVDGEGNLQSSQRYAPSVNRHKNDTTVNTTDYFVITLDGLNASTTYSYTISGINAARQHIYHEEGVFETKESSEGLFDIIAPEPNKARKVLIDGQIYILRYNKIYTLHGKEITN